MNSQIRNVTAITDESQSLVFSVATLIYLWKFNSFVFLLLKTFSVFILTLFC